MVDEAASATATEPEAPSATATEPAAPAVAEISTTAPSAIAPAARGGAEPAAAEPAAAEPAAPEPAAPEPATPEPTAAVRDAPEIAAMDAALPDGRAEIRRLADELLPALIARLSASSLGELEVSEGAWRVRLRRAPAASEPDPGASRTRATRPHGTSTGDGADPPGAAATGSAGSRASVQGQPGRDGMRVHATSPAVGYYAPRDGISIGQAVRAGDVLGHIDVLGVRQEVISPTDGLVTRQLAEPGEAVEYGQELVRLDRLQKPGARQVDEADVVAVAIGTSADAVPAAGPTNGSQPASPAAPAAPGAGLLAATGMAPDGAPR